MDGSLGGVRYRAPYSVIISIAACRNEAMVKWALGGGAAD